LSPNMVGITTSALGMESYRLVHYKPRLLFCF
jgi:hypothetical protein